MEGLDNQIKWHKAPIKFWKPNLIQKLLIKLKIIKDRRYNGRKIDKYLLDEAGHWQEPNLNYDNYWGKTKK